MSSKTTPPLSATAPPTAQPDPFQPAPEIPRTDGVRETFESIIVALILAFVFRAFVVEAFVIPTGSMAPSLRGMHANHRCGNCGYAFAYGIKEKAATPDGRVVPGTLDVMEGFNLRCPNCGWAGDGNDELNKVSRIMPDAGDRILVLKWSYDIGGAILGPHRWDVGVFKNPQDGEMNYIKRIVGVPGEVLEIINGDVYTADASALPEDLLAELAIPEPARNLTAEMLQQLNRKLRIQRKSALAQESLWMLHYDHDYPTARSRQDYRRGDFNPPRWVPLNLGDESWNADQPLVKFTPEDDEWHWLRLEGKVISDEYGYNNVNYSNVNASHFGGAFPVGDVRVGFVVTPEMADGSLSIFLRKGKDRFVATIRADGTARLERMDMTDLPVGSDGIPREIATGKLQRPLAANRPVDIEIENLDYRVTLRVDGEVVLATDDQQYAPTADMLASLRVAGSYPNDDTIAEIRIGARGTPLEIRHLQVHRDVYYTMRVHDSDREGSANGTPGWGTAGNPIYLRADPPEYFCCGDNSPQSQDSRFWVDTSQFLLDREGYQRGTVPADQLIGRAFFVYWPSGLRFSSGTIGVIPNVGRMRFIR